MKDYYTELKESITFHMSLGSKELFHSNFLQWLSVIDWNRFIEILHKLAGLNDNEKFWWEGEGETPQKFHPDNNNIEVRRECKHYDLSVYILTGYSNSRNKNSERQKKWCPVFILENKVKSMPYQSQLDGYAEKVVKEWKANIEPDKKKKDIDITQLWQGQDKKPVTFVLLSLFSEIVIQPSKIKDEQIEIKWAKKNYSDLSGFLNKPSSNKKDLTNKVIEDYRKFISALHGLSESDEWKVDVEDNYHNKILKCGNNEKDLRIADLREKIIHERMLKLLEKKLNELNELNEKFPDKCKHWNKDEEYKENKEYNTDIIFYDTSFSRGTGITQAVIIINKDYRLMIQLQNKQYRKCMILHQKDRESEKELGERQERIRKGLSECLWEGFDPSNSFGKYFKYKYEPIKEEETVDVILNKVVNDLVEICKNLKELEQIK